MTFRANGRTGFLSALTEHRLDDELRQRLGTRVAVSDGDEGEVFLYAGDQRAARAAQEVATAVAKGHGLDVKVSVDRWHPLEEEWEDATVAMPASAPERAAEHEHLMAEESEESADSGVASWEVRVRLASHRQAVELAERLQRQGESVVRRWHFLVIGASNEDEARAMQQRISAELPPGAHSDVEPGGGVGWQEGLPGTPFTFFAGLGG